MARVEQSPASMIEQTLLGQAVTGSQLSSACGSAAEFGFRAMVVNPSSVEPASRLLSGSGVRLCSVVGFPLGAGLSAVKREEASRLVELGAGAVDMVLNVGWLKDGREELVEADIAGVVEAAGSAVEVKVILECGLLTDEEKMTACRLALAAGADYVKTSTGILSSGATVEDVELLRRAVGSGAGVKASGGVRGLSDLWRMIRAGADIVGTSSGKAIMDEYQATGSTGA